MTRTEYTETNPNLPGITVLEFLRAVIDPELGIDIVNLGMVYRIQVNRGDVRVEMTLTTPGCPLHGSIRADVEQVLMSVPGIDTVNVELVWDPPWTPDLMSDEAKYSLGFP
mgnify:CR=1 FL=1